MFLETILQQLTQTLSLVPSCKQRECADESDKNDDDHDDDDDERSDSEEDLVLNDLDESAESGDSEIEGSENEPELFDQVIRRSGRLGTTWQSRFLVRNYNNKAIFLGMNKVFIDF